MTRRSALHVIATALQCALLLAHSEGEDHAVTCMGAACAAFDEVSALQVHATLRAGADRDALGTSTQGSEGVSLEQMLAEQNRFPSLRQEEKDVIAAAGGDVSTQQEMRNTLLEVEKSHAADIHAPLPAASVGKKEPMRISQETAVVLPSDAEGYSSFSPDATMEKLEALIQQEKTVIASENSNIVQMQAMHPMLQQLSSRVEAQQMFTGKDCKSPTITNSYASGACNVNGATVAAGATISDGSICTTQCATGYTASISSLTCSAGALTPETFSCDAMQCKAPTDIDNVATAGACAEGEHITFGTSCTPSCLPGYTPTITSMSCVADSSGQVQLTYAGSSTFQCEANLDKCQAPTVTNQAVGGACLEGTLLTDGSTCTAQCATGYQPSVTGLSCKKGQFTPTGYVCQATQELLSACSDADATTVNNFVRAEMADIASKITNTIDCATLHADGYCDELSATEGGKAMCPATCGHCKELPIITPGPTLSPAEVWTVDKAALMTLEAFPILGALGVTRFYMGCWVTGALQGLSSCISLGIVGHIWAFTDFLILENNAFNDETNIDVFGMHANFEQGKMGPDEYSSVKSANKIAYICIATWTLYTVSLIAGYYRFFTYYY